MNNKFRLTAAVMVVSLSMVVVVRAAGATATQPAAVSVDELIKQLGSDSADDRDAAQAKLVDRGQAAVPQLKKAADEDDDPEVRSRAAAALAQMKDQDANGPSLITAHLYNAPVQDVLGTIGEQAHTSFLGFGGMLIPGRPNPSISLNADRKPFWEVMSDVCGQLNVCPTIDATGARNGIRLYQTNRNWMTDSPHIVSGPFWINVSKVYHTDSIDLAGPAQASEIFAVDLSVVPEPKLSVGQMSDLQLKEARDDAGNSLMPPPEPKIFGAFNLIRNSPGAGHSPKCLLKYPDHPGKKITVLRGEITASLGQDVKRYQVDNVLGTSIVSNPLLGCKVASSVMHQGTEMYRVTIQCTRDGVSQEQWSAMLNHAGDIELEDADGHSLAGLQTSIASGNIGAGASFTATTLFSRSNFAGPIGAAHNVTRTGEARRLTWNVATSVKPVVIQVLFNDLPMP